MRLRITGDCTLRQPCAFCAASSIGWRRRSTRSSWMARERCGSCATPCFWKAHFVDAPVWPLVVARVGNSPIGEKFGFASLQDWLQRSRYEELAFAGTGYEQDWLRGEGAIRCAELLPCFRSMARLRLSRCRGRQGVSIIAALTDSATGSHPTVESVWDTHG